MARPPSLLELTQPRVGTGGALPPSASAPSDQERQAFFDGYRAAVAAGRVHEYLAANAGLISRLPDGDKTSLNMAVGAGRAQIGAQGAQFTKAASILQGLGFGKPGPVGRWLEDKTGRALNDILGIPAGVYHLATTDPRKSLPELAQGTWRTITHPGEDPFATAMLGAAAFGGVGGLVGRGAAVRATVRGAAPKGFTEALARLPKADAQAYRTLTDPATHAADMTVDTQARLAAPSRALLAVLDHNPHLAAMRQEILADINAGKIAPRPVPSAAKPAVAVRAAGATRPAQVARAAVRKPPPKQRTITTPQGIVVHPVASRNYAANEVLRAWDKLTEARLGNPSPAFPRVAKVISPEAKVSREAAKARSVLDALQLAPVSRLERFGRTTPAAAVHMLTGRRVDVPKIVPRTKGQRLSAGEQKAVMIHSTGLTPGEHIIAHQYWKSQGVGSARWHDIQIGLAKAAEAHLLNPRPALQAALRETPQVVAKREAQLGMTPEEIAHSVGARVSEVRAAAQGVESPLQEHARLAAEQARYETLSTGAYAGKVAQVEAMLNRVLGTIKSMPNMAEITRRQGEIQPMLNELSKLQEKLGTTAAEEKIQPAAGRVFVASPEKTTPQIVPTDTRYPVTGQPAAPPASSPELTAAQDLHARAEALTETPRHNAKIVSEASAASPDVAQVVADFQDIKRSDFDHGADGTEEYQTEKASAWEEVVNALDEHAAQVEADLPEPTAPPPTLGSPPPRTVTPGTTTPAEVTAHEVPGGPRIKLAQTISNMRAELARLERTATKDAPKNAQIAMLNKELDRLSGSKTAQELASLEARAVTRPQRMQDIHTAITAEGFAAVENGAYYIPAVRTMGQKIVQSPGFRRLSPYGLGPLRPLPELTHEYTGALQRSGNFRTDATGLVAQSYRRAQRWASLQRGYQELLAHAAPTPDGIAFPVAIRPNLPIPEALKELFGKADRGLLTSGDAGRLSQAETDAWARQVFPDARLLSTAEKQGVRWIDARYTKALTKEAGGYLGGAGKVLDAINNPLRASLLYTKPAYALNLLQALGQNVIRQGVFTPVNMANALRMGRTLGADDQHAILSLVGTGMSRSLDQGTGVGASAIHGAGEFWNAVVDRYPRAAAWLHEARAEGFNTPEKIHELLNNEEPAMRAKLVDVTRRANREAIDYGNLTPAERNVVKRAIFFYPWLRGATLYGLRFPVEHPVQAGAAAETGQLGAAESDRAFGLRPSFYQGLVATPWGASNPAAVNTFATPAELARGGLGLVQGRSPNAGDLAQNLSPALGALYTLATGKTTLGSDLPSGQSRLGGAFNALAQDVGPYALYQRANRKPLPGQPAEQQPVFPGGPGAALGRWLGGAVYPQQPNLAAMNARGTADLIASMTPEKRIDYRSGIALRTAQQNAARLRMSLPPHVAEAIELARQRDHGLIDAARKIGTKVKYLTPAQRQQVQADVALAAGRIDQAGVDRAMREVAAAPSRERAQRLVGHFWHYYGYGGEPARWNTYAQRKLGG